METDDLINKLQKIREDNKENNDNNDNDNDNHDNNKNNQTLCKQLKIHLKDFYDNIYIPFNFFKDNNWNINKVINDNDDALFYNKTYLTPTDEDRFYQVFDKYVIMIEEIMSPTNILSIYLKKWTDTSKKIWKSLPNKSFLKKILTTDKYQYISPNYIATLFREINIKFPDQPDKIREEMRQQLNNLRKEIKTEINSFKNIYKKIIQSYVFECPLNYNETRYYVKGFINSLIMAIVNFSEKLIDLNTYAIHSIVVDIIGFHISLDEINKPPSKTNKPICIV